MRKWVTTQSAARGWTSFFLARAQPLFLEKGEEGGGGCFGCGGGVEGRGGGRSGSNDTKIGFPFSLERREGEGKKRMGESGGIGSCFHKRRLWREEGVGKKGASSSSPYSTMERRKESKFAGRDAGLSPTEAALRKR